MGASWPSRPHAEIVTAAKLAPKGRLQPSLALTMTSRTPAEYWRGSDPAGRIAVGRNSDRPGEARRRTFAYECLNPGPEAAT